MTLTRSGRLVAAATLISVLGGCHSGASKGWVGASSTRADVAIVVPTSTPVPTSPRAAEPAVDPSKLRSILLSPADVPPGFVPGPVGAGDDLLSMRPCGLTLVDAGGHTAEVRQVLVRAGDDLRMVEQVDGFASTGAAAHALDALRSLGRACHLDGAASVSGTSPPAVGEDVAGLKATGPARHVLVAMVRSGPIVTIIALRSHRPIPGATFDAVFRAAGTRLAVGTGG